MEREEILGEILSKNEVKVYLALLELGSTTAWELARLSKVHRTNVYDALRGLMKKGLVSYVVKGKTKYFEALNPKNIISFIKEKELKLQSILPRLSASFEAVPTKDKAHVSEGMAGIRATTEDILSSLSKGDSVLTFGVPKDVAKRMSSFVDTYHKRRIKKKIFQKHIYDENARERIAYLNKLPYTEAKYLPKKYNSPATTTIYGNKTAFWIWSQNPFIIVVESERMANAYRRYFELLWKVAKKS